MIETARLRLRPLHQNDVETFVRELNNFEITRNLSRVPFPYLASDATDFIKFAGTVDGRSLICAIAPKASPDQLIGVISYEFSVEKNNAELGYWLAEAHWGKGLMSEAAEVIAQHAFTISKTETLIACHHNDNPVSGRILTKLGFVEVAHSTSFSKAQGKAVAVTNLSLSRNLWLAQQKSRGE